MQMNAFVFDRAVNYFAVLQKGARFKRLIENVMKTANGELNAFTFVSTQVCLYYMLYC